ncbi:MAG: hypothetical protein V4555_18645 [Acidobacteriota bacterium]
MATVTSCRYDAGAGRALAFGIPSSRHFSITFNYWVPTPDGEPILHTGQFMSEKAIPQNTLFPIRYNPADPRQHSKNAPHATGRTPLLAIAIIGSIILSAAWLLILRSCN